MTSSESVEAAPGFFAYPKAIEGPAVPYSNTQDKNPVFRGWALSAGATIVSKSSFVQGVLWKNAKFDTLRGLITDLEPYANRHDPTVVPVGNASIETSRYDDPAAFTPQPQDLPGRYNSVHDYHSLYLKGELTPLAVAKALLPLIKRDVEPKGKHSVAFISTHEESVLAAAKASTERYAQGKPLGILDGVPVSIKDELNVEGYPTTFGRKHNPKLPTQKESIWPVKKLVEAGAVIVGKLNMHELGADTTNNNPNYGTPLNPHNPGFYTGGSSGGAAYSTSVGLTPIALGTDGGGSVRIPSTFCGVYGLKPSHSRLEEVPSTVTVVGPLASTLSDLEVMYRVMAQPNPARSPFPLFQPPGPITTSSSRPKVLGIYRAWFDRATPIVRDTCQRAVDYYVQKLGYQLVDITLPFVPEGQLAHVITILAEMAAFQRSTTSTPTDWVQELNPANKVLLSVAEKTPAQDYLLAQKMRSLIMSHLAWLWKEHPGMVIVTPTSTIAGWKIQDGDLSCGVTDGNMSIRNMEYVWLANFTGCPAITCPVGYVEPEGGQGGLLPVGLMGMGEWGSEDALIAWGRGAEEWLDGVYEGGRRRPQNWEDVIAAAKKQM